VLIGLLNAQCDFDVIARQNSETMARQDADVIVLQDADVIAINHKKQFRI